MLVKAVPIWLLGKVRRDVRGEKVREMGCEEVRWMG